MKKGQVLVEAVVTFPALILSIFIGTSLVLSWGASNLLDFELYSLARSKMYGIKRPCKLSEHWPKLDYFKANIECHENGTYAGEIRIMNKYILRNSVSIEGNNK